MDGVINIAFTSDINYFSKLAVAIMSIKENMREENVHIFVFTDEKNRNISCVERIEKLSQKNLKITFLYVGENDFQGYEVAKTGTHLTIATIYRLQLGNLLPNEIDKILFLDTDMLICSNLKELYMEDLGDLILGAVVEGAEEDRRNLKENASYLFDYYDSEEEAYQSYFNAGTMLINMVEFRKQNIGKRCIQMLFDHPEFRLYDQDALNILCKGQIKYLEPKWNRIWRRELADGSEGTGCLAESMDDINIIHYCTGLKPWSDPEYKLADKFFQIAYDTEWYPEIVEEFRTITLKRIFKYKFPWNQVKAGERIIVYGAGEVGESFVRQIELTEFCIIKYVVDKNADHIDSVRGVITVRPEKLYNIYKGEKIVIGIMKEHIREAVKNTLVDMGIPENKIVSDYDVR